VNLEQTLHSYILLQFPSSPNKKKQCLEVGFIILSALFNRIVCSFPVGLKSSKLSAYLRVELLLTFSYTFATEAVVELVWDLIT